MGEFGRYCSSKIVENNELFIYLVSTIIFISPKNLGETSESKFKLKSDFKSIFLSNKMLRLNLFVCLVI